ncbi:hypothetical protein [Streptomyces peucetius]
MVVGLAARDRFNGMPGARIDKAGGPTAVSPRLVEDDRITRIHAVHSPHKPGWLE